MRRSSPVDSSPTLSLEGSDYDPSSPSLRMSSPIKIKEHVEESGISKQPPSGMDLSPRDQSFNTSLKRNPISIGEGEAGPDLLKRPKYDVKEQLLIPSSSASPDEQQDRPSRPESKKRPAPFETAGEPVQGQGPSAARRPQYSKSSPSFRRSPSPGDGQDRPLSADLKRRPSPSYSKGDDRRGGAGKNRLPVQISPSPDNHADGSLSPDLKRKSSPDLKRRPNPDYSSRRVDRRWADKNRPPLQHSQSPESRRDQSLSPDLNRRPSPDNSRADNKSRDGKSRASFQRRSQSPGNQRDRPSPDVKRRPSPDYTKGDNRRGATYGKNRPSFQRSPSPGSRRGRHAGPESRRRPSPDYSRGGDSKRGTDIARRPYRRRSSSSRRSSSDSDHDRPALRRQSPARGDRNRRSDALKEKSKSGRRRSPSSSSYSSETNSDDSGKPSPPPKKTGPIMYGGGRDSGRRPGIYKPRSSIAQSTDQAARQSKFSDTPSVVGESTSSEAPASKLNPFKNLQFSATVQEKRKLLWSSNKPLEEDQSATSAGTNKAVGSSVAMWESVEFEDASRKDKFLALMGAKKHKPVEVKAISSEGQAASEVAPVSQQNLLHNLERQFVSSAMRQHSRRGLGI
mmetsp:Transcript_25043/g.41254  ORF Transcript_25043/g.41254 Transcript_25043/m.41254 type:complete len:623 (-) Transcript_25043:556-2424(-)